MIGYAPEWRSRSRLRSCRATSLRLLSVLILLSSSVFILVLFCVVLVFMGLSLMSELVARGVLAGFALLATCFLVLYILGAEKFLFLAGFACYRYDRLGLTCCGNFLFPVGNLFAGVTGLLFCG